MIFVTLGSQKFQFNRLLKKVDELIEKKIIDEPVFAQIGASNYIPKNYNYRQFLGREEFKDYLESCDIVITHGGTGVIINAVKCGKKVIAVPRLAKYGEHVDDHQTQLIAQFDELDLICPCMDADKLDEAIITAQKTEYKTYISNTKSFISDLRTYLDGGYLSDKGT